MPFSILARRDRAPVVAVATALLVLYALPVFAHGHDAQSDHADDPHHEEVHHHGADNDDHLAEHDGFRVVHGWTNAGGGETTLVFMELQNTGARL